MANGRLNLTRDQLAAFLKDHQSIKQFELLFSTVDAIAPDFVNEINIAAENAGSRAQQALDTLQRIADALELLALSPTALASFEEAIGMTTIEALQADNLAPPVQIGTLGQQQADRVSVSGGTVAAQLKNNQTILLETTTALTNGAAAAAGTLLNAPAAGNPTKWVAVNDNGTTRYIPTW